MEGQAREECDFVLVRYVPDPVRNEFVNIGVLLRSTAGTQVRFTRDWSRVRCMDPAADTGMLEALESELRSRLEQRDGARGEKPTRQWMEDTLSTGIQLTEPKATLAESAAAELDSLMRLYVERPARVIVEARPERGRAALVRKMRIEFERAGVWEHMHKRISAAQYTRKGDPLRIDCGYRPNGVIRMFHAVSLETETETAKVLAYTYPKLVEGVRRVEGTTLELTAMVEPLAQVSSGDDEVEERYRFAVETMEQSGMRVFTPSDMQRAAATAARELGV